MDANLQDLELQNPDDPTANSDLEMVEMVEKIVNELRDENLSPEELPLINILMEVLLVTSFHHKVHYLFFPPFPPFLYRSLLKDHLDFEALDLEGWYPFLKIE